MPFTFLSGNLRTKAAVAASSVLTLVGVLAITATASAAQISTSTLQAQNTNADNLLVAAAKALQGSGDQNLGTTPITSASALNATIVKQITADAVSPQYQQQVEAALGQANYQQLPAAASAYSELPQLITLAGDDPSDYPGGLYTVKGDLGVSSKATVTGAGQPTAYSLTIATNSNVKDGYVLPSGVSFTFPARFSLNMNLTKDEIKPAGEAHPKSLDSIGTVTLHSPAAKAYGLSKTDQVKGKIYMVALGGDEKTPGIELSFAPGIYALSSPFASHSFPLTVSFGETTVGSGTDPLPFSSLDMAFPAKTSPLEASSCSNLGTATGAATDEVAPLANTLGDSNSAYAESTGSIKVAGTRTVVTNDCQKATKTSLKAGSKKLKRHKADKFTVTVAAGKTKATGKVKLYDGKKVVGTKPLKKGKAVFTDKKLKVGANKIVAKYQGVKNKFKASKTKTVTVKVTNANTNKHHKK